MLSPTSTTDGSGVPTSMTQTRSCNVTACRSLIADLISHNQTYNTMNLGECSGCSTATSPNFPNDWLQRWYVEDMVIWSSAGYDCPANPRYGTLAACQILCLQAEACVGFSREKNALVNDSTSECWLKNETRWNQSLNDSTWHTYAFNATS